MRELGQHLKRFNLSETIFLELQLKDRWFGTCNGENDDIKDNFCEETDRMYEQLPEYDKKILLGDFNENWDVVGEWIW